MPKAKGKRQRDSLPNKSSAASNLTNSAKKRKTTSGVAKPQTAVPLVDKSTFGLMVESAGFHLMAGDHPNQLSVDQVMFQKKIRKAVKSSMNLEKTIEDFITGLQNHIEDSVRLKYSLLPTMSSAECESARGGNQDSLIRLLLGVDEMQPALVNMLLEKLPEFMGEEDSMFDYSEAVDLPKLILNQFHWLDRVINSKEMTDKMLEMVEISSLSVQQEIIACIPEVVSDQEHHEVTTRLKNMLECNTQLTVPIIDALDNLNLTPELVREVRASALQSLVSADLDDLPVVIKFILQSVNSSDALEVISELRKNLDFQTTNVSSSTSTPFASSSRPGNGKANKKTADSELLILDTIKSTIRFNKVLADGWQKAIENVSSSAEHKVVDIFVLLISHAIANRKKSVEALFRKKVRQGHFTEELLQATFTSHSKVIRGYLSSLLCIAEKLLRSPEPQVSQFGATVYKTAFLAFDMHYKQEVIGALVTHIGSGLSAEMDMALDILTSLATGHTSDLAPFAVFIKGVLDYLDNLTMSQVKKLFSVLAALAYTGGQVGSTLQDELHIVVRKNLTSNSPKYKRIGVVAALMVIKNMASKRPDSRFSTHTIPALPQDVLKQVMSLLDLVKSSSNHSPEAIGLFYDEMANIIQKGELHPKVLETIGENILEDFQSDFIVDIEAEILTRDYGLPMGEQYSLEGEESQIGVAINLLPLLHKAKRLQASGHSKGRKKERFVSPTSLAPHFRLLRVCEHAQHDGSLEGIDALLGCPLYSAKEDVVAKIHSLSAQEKEMLCSNLFICLNWFREAINGFASLQDAEMRSKVLGRLQHITHLQSLLQSCLHATPDFVPPPANFDCEKPEMSVTLTAASGASSSKARGGKKGKKSKSEKKKADDTCNSTILTEYDYISQDNNKVSDTQHASPNKDGAKKDGSDSTSVVVDWSRSRAFLREMDLDVFSVLGCGLVSKTILDTEMNTKDVQVFQLQPPELEFLLEDLNSKLDHALPASVGRRTFLKAKWDKTVGFSHLDQLTPCQVAKKAVKMLPLLCQHLETTSGFFQALMAENDGMIDGPGWNSEEAGQMGRCLHLLLKAVHTIISWSGFVSSENQSMIEEALSTLSSRISDAGKTTFSAAEILKNAFHYIENFSGTVPKLGIGVTILSILMTLNKRGTTGKASKKIASLAESLLKRDWMSEDGLPLKGAEHNEQLQQVLETYLHHVEDPLSTIEMLTTDAIPELLQGNKNTVSALFPTLSRNSLSCYYHTMLKELVSNVQRLQPSLQSSADDQGEVFDRWRSAVKVFGGLVGIIKAFDMRTNLKSLLKYGRVFLEVFLRQGMPLMDKLFRTQRDDVQSLLKILQQGTRSLQHVCSHSKVAKDIALTSHVPQMKKLLEQFVYRVKAMLTLHNCLDAFWVGNLKNRDLKGDEIPSQMSRADTEEDEEEEEEDGDLGSQLLSSDDSDDEGDKEEEAAPAKGNQSDSEVSCSESF
ncbi:Fanconi anemia group D2 protein-like [Diadema antillarum]|uniref:Fanconi anemia group D2 protein-like n=1 Tax=Diadema antillarum TaxID=105358 RepID=UPI003A87691B